MRIGYIRVSPTGRQNDNIAQMNVEKVYIEKASSKEAKRPELRNMLASVHRGDVVVVHELSRIARSVSDLYDIVSGLNKKGAVLESIKEDIDLSSSAATVGVLEVMARFERSLMLERQKDGIAEAKARGKRWGRKATYGTDERVVNEVFSDYHAKKISYEEATTRLGMKKSTFYYRYNKWMEEQHIDRVQEGSK